MTSGRIDSLALHNNEADFSGSARLDDGSLVQFRTGVVDGGDGNSDTFNISLNNGYSAGGTLTSGDIRIY